MCLAIEGSETIKKDCTTRSNHQTIIQRRSHLLLSFQLIFKCTAEEKSTSSWKWTNLGTESQTKNSTISKEKLIKWDEESLIPNSANRPFCLWNARIITQPLREELKKLLRHTQFRQTLFDQWRESSPQKKKSLNLTTEETVITSIAYY